MKDSTRHSMVFRFWWWQLVAGGKGLVVRGETYPDQLYIRWGMEKMGLDELATVFQDCQVGMRMPPQVKLKEMGV